MTEFIYGLLLGALTIGSTTYRTIKVYEGDVWATAWTSMLHSGLYYAAMNQIVEKNIMGYIGFSFGAGLSTCYLAYQRRRK